MILAMERRIGWDPWADLRRRSHIVFARVPLPKVLGGGYYEKRRSGTALLIDHDLDQMGRLDVVAHELTHEDMPWATEDQVDDEVARRLVPFDDLSGMWQVALVNDLSIEVWQIAEKFDVPDHVAERAMRLFLRSVGIAPGDCSDDVGSLTG